MYLPIHEAAGAPTPEVPVSVDIKVPLSEGPLPGAQLSGGPLYGGPLSEGLMVNGPISQDSGKSITLEPSEARPMITRKAQDNTWAREIGRFEEVVASR